MPELPEVQTIINELIPLVCRRKITNIEFLRPNILQKSAAVIRDVIQGKTIQTITRRGKYIIFELDGHTFLTAHLKMTGKFVCMPADTSIHVHDRLILKLSGQLDLRFNDVRTLGRINVFASKTELETLVGDIGIDPIAKEFPDYDLYNALKKRTCAVKSFLMDAKNIAGIGNIYASEILFHARIHPKKLCNRIGKNKAGELQKTIVRILNEALEHNGTTISDYKRVDSKTGNFQNFLRVYGRKDEACHVCGKKILRMVQQQRSTFYCPGCQK